MKKFLLFSFLLILAASFLFGYVHGKRGIGFLDDLKFYSRYWQAPSPVEETLVESESLPVEEVDYQDKYFRLHRGMAGILETELAELFRLQSLNYRFTQAEKTLAKIVLLMKKEGDWKVSEQQQAWIRQSLPNSEALKALVPPTPTPTPEPTAAPAPTSEVKPEPIQDQKEASPSPSPEQKPAPQASAELEAGAVPLLIQKFNAASSLDPSSENGKKYLGAYSGKIDLPSDPEGGFGVFLELKEGKKKNGEPGTAHLLELTNFKGESFTRSTGRDEVRLSPAVGGAGEMLLIHLGGGTWLQMVYLPQSKELTGLYAEQWQGGLKVTGQVNLAKKDGD